MENKGKLLAIDFGDRNTGLAVCDESQTFVFGRGVLSGYKRLDELFEKIVVLCQEENIVEIVFGVPLGKEGEETEQSRRHRDIGSRLEQYIGTISVVYQDESHTSFEANSVVKDPKLRKKYSEHELAAVVILNRYLELSNW